MNHSPLLPEVDAYADETDAIPSNQLSDSEKERILGFQQAILESIAHGHDHMKVINDVCILAEQLLPNSVASVMLLDAAGELLNVHAAPSLGPESIAKLNGLRPGPGAGSCGNVVYCKEPVFVPDTFTDPRWHDLRQLAIDFNLMACWSVPVRTSGRKIVGTFALSSFERRHPRPFHKKMLQIGASIIGIVLERSHQADSLRLMGKVFESSREGIMITDSELRVVSVNPAFCAMTGHDSVDLVGDLPGFLSRGPDHGNILPEIQPGLKAQGHWHGEVWNRRKDGSVFPEWLSVSAVRDSEERVTHYVGFHFDISERKAAEARIHFLAYHDSLTELPNRLLARERLGLAMAHADRAGAKAALLFLDLDSFKTINDSLGHFVGDALLKEVARRLDACTRATDTLSRQGGDEFLIVLSNVRKPEDIAGVAEKIMREVLAPFVIEGHALTTSVSMGVAVYPDDGRDFETLLKKADMAMYEAKAAGRNTYRCFTAAMNTDAVQHLNMRNGLRGALERDEFVLHYQPQVDLESGKTIGAEALLRWNHPEQGLVSPASFIPVAENSGLIVPIGDWVLREACRQAMQWSSVEGRSDLIVAVNLSAAQFQRGDLEKTVSAALAESGLDPARLELELTESILIRDSENVLATVRRLKSIGVKLSIDDFGTGYSSLAYLKRFAVDKLKIDQSFVRGMADDANDAAIVAAVIQMSRSLGLTTIAEGVENERVRDLLLERGCDEAQGYFFARPMPAESLARHLAAGTAIFG